MYRYPRQTLPAISPSIRWWRGITGAQADWGPVFTILFVSKGSGHYLSPAKEVGGGGEEGKDFSGDHLIFGRTKGGISRNWEP